MEPGPVRGQDEKQERDTWGYTVAKGRAQEKSQTDLGQIHSEDESGRIAMEGEIG